MAGEIKEKRLEETLRRSSIFFLFVLVLSVSCHVLTNFDIWWHLRAGKYILQNHQIPQQDIFSYTAAGRPWIDLHWLFQVFSFNRCLLRRIENFAANSSASFKSGSSIRRTGSDRKSSTRIQESTGT